MGTIGDTSGGSWWSMNVIITSSSLWVGAQALPASVEHDLEPPTRQVDTAEVVKEKNGFHAAVLPGRIP